MTRLLKEMLELFSLVSTCVLSSNVTLCHVMLSQVMLCYTIPCYVMLCHFISGFVMLYNVV